MASIFTSGVFEGFDSNGDPLAGGKLYTYAAGTTTPLASYTNQGGGTPNANPVILDSAGRANVWLGSSAYRLLLKTSADVTVWDTDNVRSAADLVSLAAPTGASLVGYIASGTGAVATTVQTKLRESVSVKNYGAVGNGTTNDTAAIQAAIDAHQRVYFPEGNYLCNILLNGTDGKTLVGEVQGHNNGVRLIPASSASPVIKIIGPSIDTVVENFTLDSKLDGTYSGAGVGLGLEAASPAYVWRCAFRHLFIRGFQDGLVINCDINISEVFDNDFEDIEIIGCSRYSVKSRGVYNTWRKVFATQCGDYAFYNDGSNCTFDSIVGDGRMAFYGGGQHVTNAVIEAIYGVGAGASPAFEINGNTSTFRGIRLNDVPTAKYSIGVSIYGQGQIVDDMVVEGASYPATPVKLFSGSSGVLRNIRGPSGATTINTTSASYLENWLIEGDTENMFTGPKLNGLGLKFLASPDYSSDANTLDEYKEGTWSPTILGTTGAAGVTYTSSAGRYVKIGKVVYVSFAIVLSSKGTISGEALIGGLPFTVSNNGLPARSFLGIGIWGALATAKAWLGAYTIPNTTTGQLVASAGAVTGSENGMNTTALSDTTTLIGSGAYESVS